MSSFTIKSTLKTLPMITANISILLRGETGIGKSFIVKAYAKKLGLPMIDRRLSQMTEGDLLGLPSITDGCTSFNPPNWVHEACQKPVVLFLDEMNRATREVQQGAFQLVLDRELNGYKLHPETRVCAAVNVGGKYSVNDMDAALLRRFFVIDLNPDVADWITYARANNISEFIVSFIENNQKMLDPAEKAAHGSVQPTRASWERLNELLVANGLTEAPNDPNYFDLAKGMVGAEVASALVQYGKTFKFQVSAEDVWYHYADKKSDIPERMKKLGQEQWLATIERVADFTKKWKVMPKECGKHLKAFFEDMPEELRPDAWGKLIINGASENGNDHAEFAKSIHEFVVVAIVTGTFGVEVGAAGINQKPKIPQLLQDRMNNNK